MNRRTFKWPHIILWLASITIILGCGNVAENTIDQKPIELLIEGNKRYITSKVKHPHQNHHRLIEISNSQDPFAVVLSCSDSRVPPEIIFDQGLGDLFVIRTAGNVIGNYELASLEYAVIKLNCKVLMVMGHENCGAIKVFSETPLDSLPGHLNYLTEFIGQEPFSLSRVEHADQNTLYQLTIDNVLYGVNLIRDQSSIITERLKMGELEIYGAIYHVDNGKVEIIEDIVNSPSK